METRSALIFMLILICFKSTFSLRTGFSNEFYSHSNVDSKDVSFDLFFANSERVRRDAPVGAAEVTTTTNAPSSTLSTAATTISTTTATTTAATAPSSSTASTSVPTAPSPSTTTTASTSTTPVITTKATNAVTTTTTPSATTTTINLSQNSSDATIINKSYTYYTVQPVVNPSADGSPAYWVELDDKRPAGLTVINHEALSNAHRRASTVDLRFDFPFYGHLIREVTIATGGFLYVGEFLHPWLAATQYIAPLMANFDTTIGSTSNIRYVDNGTRFTVQWEDVVLQDQPQLGNFTFQVTLYKDGLIVFGYKKVPVSIRSISSTQHPVKIGVADAYVEERKEGNTRHRTIYEYSRIPVEFEVIAQARSVLLVPLRTCLSAQNCFDCDLLINPKLDCVWCWSVKRCSDGYDRRRQEWLQGGCHNQKNLSDCREPPNGADDGAVGRAIGVVIGIILLVMLVILLIAIVYGYKYPTSSVGIWLIEHRPTRLLSRARTLFNRSPTSGTSQTPMGPSGHSQC